MRPEVYFRLPELYRKYICVVSGHEVCGNLLQRLQERHMKDTLLCVYSFHHKSRTILHIPFFNNLLLMYSVQTKSQMLSTGGYHKEIHLCDHSSRSRALPRLPPPTPKPLTLVLAPTLQRVWAHSTSSSTPRPSVPAHDLYRRSHHLYTAHRLFYEAVIPTQQRAQNLDESSSSKTPMNCPEKGSLRTRSQKLPPHCQPVSPFLPK